MTPPKKIKLKKISRRTKTIEPGISELWILYFYWLELFGNHNFFSPFYFRSGTSCLSMSCPKISPYIFELDIHRDLQGRKKIKDGYWWRSLFILYTLKLALCIFSIPFSIHFQKTKKGNLGKHQELQVPFLFIYFSIPVTFTKPLFILTSSFTAKPTTKPRLNALPRLNRQRCLNRRLKRKGSANFSIALTLSSSLTLSLSWSLSNAP